MVAQLDLSKRKEGNPLLLFIIESLNQVVVPLSKGGIAISGTMISLMMFLTFFDVIGRYFFNKPITGSFEVTEFLMAMLVIFGLGYCAMRKGHIRVDLLISYLSNKTKIILDIFTYSVAALFYIMITWQSWNYTISKFNSHATSSALSIPVYPFAILLILGAGFISLVFIRDTFESINEVFKK
jgi:TRAP-type transport system small permease protein